MNITPRTKVEFSGELTLSEVELRALDALVGYGVEPFLKVFYEKLGKAYMQPHEAGLRSLFKAIGEGVHPQLSRIDAARKLLTTGLIKAKDNT